MTNTCICGKFHYSLDHYFAIHGDYLGRTPEHRVQVPFLPNGKLYDPKKIKDDEPFPLLTWKWVCKHCGNFNPSENPSQHKKNCAFITYLEFRETEPFKAGVKFTKTKPTETKKPEEEKPDQKPKPDEKPPKYEPTDKEKAKINEYRNQLLNILIAYEFDFSDEPSANFIIGQFKEERKDRPVGWFWEELKRISEIEEEDYINKMTQWPMWRKYAWFCQLWEDTETGASFTYQPEKKRRMLDWYLLGKLSYNYLLKLQDLRDKNDKPKLDPSKKYLLSDLLLLIPKRKKPKPKPQNAPLKDQIERFDKEFTERTVKYIELDLPPFFPSDEIDRLGKQLNYWKEDSWRNYLESAKDTQNSKGTFIDLEKRINTLKTIFAIVIIERLIEKKNKHELEGFIANYDKEPEKSIYEQEKYKDKIKDILEGNATPYFEPDDLYAKPKYYDELLTSKERNEAEEWLFSSLTANQWNELDEESELKKGVFELRKFPNLKKLKIKVERPYMGASVIKKIDLSATADNLEELDLSQSEHLQEIIIGKKPNLKKIDCRWTSLKKLNLKNTQIKPQDYDTLNFPIRMKTADQEVLNREEKESDWDWEMRNYKQGLIIWPFADFTGDPLIIGGTTHQFTNFMTLPLANITFNIPWLRYGKDWSNIAIQFKDNPEYIQEWYDNKFDYDSAKEWMNLWKNDPARIKQAEFCWWLRSIQKKNAEWVLKHGKLEELRADYNKWVEENEN